MVQTAKYLLLLVVGLVGSSVVLCGVLEAKVLEKELAKALKQEPDPHQHKDRCEACHGDKTENLTFKDILAIEKTCKRCHELPLTHHDFPARIKNVDFPKDFVSHNKNLMCQSCHIEHEPKNSPPPYLRNGPYKKLYLFCKNCHSDLEELKSPHKVKSHTEGCRLCHRGPQPPNKQQWPLKTIVSRICLACHQGEIHPGVLEHVGQKIEKPPKALPLGNKSRMECITCHDPHEKDLLKGRKVFAHLLRMKLDKGELCVSCHDY